MGSVRSNNGFCVCTWPCIKYKNSPNMCHALVKSLILVGCCKGRQYPLFQLATILMRKADVSTPILWPHALTHALMKVII